MNVILCNSSTEVSQGGRVILCFSGQGNGANRTKAFVKELLGSEMIFQGGAKL